MAARVVETNFKKPKKRKPTRVNQTKTCDSLFSKVIRSRGSCENCGQTTTLQCAHGFSRRYRAVRWDERNAFCFCARCHLYYTMRPLEWDDWLLERLGEQLYSELRGLALHAANPVLRDMLTILKNRAAELGIAA